MEQYGRPGHINENTYRYISDVMSKDTYTPSLALNLIMDELFKGHDWWDYEYETILKMLSDSGFKLPNVHIMGQIQALSAVRSGQSLIDKEWHLFEKTVLSLTGIPVLFYEKQNVPLEHVIHAVSLLKKLGTAEFSEEVRYYIGCEALNDDILWHPTESVDADIQYALSILNTSMGISPEEVSQIRDGVRAKFNDIVSNNLDIDEVKIDESSVEDMMLLRIYRSLLIGYDLTVAEASELKKAEQIISGQSLYTSETSEKPADSVEESASVEDSRDPNEVFEYNVEEISSGLAPDVVSFEDGVKEATVKAMDEIIHIYDKDDITLKLAQIDGVPIPTGIPSGGEEDDSDGPSYDLEETAPLEGNAIEAMSQAVENDVSKVIEPSSRHEIEDSGSIFEL